VLYAANTPNQNSWFEEHAYITSWIQTVGTLLALLAIIVTIDHFRRSGFRPHVVARRDNRKHRRVDTSDAATGGHPEEVAQARLWQYLQVDVENRGRASGRIDQIHLATVTRQRWPPFRRRPHWTKAQDRQVAITPLDDTSAPRSPLPVELPGHIREELALLCPADAIEEKHAAVVVLAGGRRVIKRLRRTKVQRLTPLPDVGHLPRQRSANPHSGRSLGKRAAALRRRR